MNEFSPHVLDMGLLLCLALLDRSLPTLLRERSRLEPIHGGRYSSTSLDGGHHFSSFGCGAAPPDGTATSAWQGTPSSGAGKVLCIVH